MSSRVRDVVASTANYHLGEDLSAMRTFGRRIAQVFNHEHRRPPATHRPHRAHGRPRPARTQAARTSPAIRRQTQSVRNGPDIGDVVCTNPLDRISGARGVSLLERSGLLLDRIGSIDKYLGVISL